MTAQTFADFAQHFRFLLTNWKIEDLFHFPKLFVHFQPLYGHVYHFFADLTAQNFKKIKFEGAKKSSFRMSGLYY